VRRFEVTLEARYHGGDVFGTVTETVEADDADEAVQKAIERAERAWDSPRPKPTFHDLLVTVRRVADRASAARTPDP
jgi:hypothetical protein